MLEDSLTDQSPSRTFQSIRQIEMKIIFLDTEFTGEHSKTTLVSAGFVTLDNKKLYITLNDYNKDQVTPWLKKNVLSKIDKKFSISSREAYQKVSKF